MSDPMGGVSPSTVSMPPISGGAPCEAEPLSSPPDPSRWLARAYLASASCLDPLDPRRPATLAELGLPPDATVVGVTWDHLRQCDDVVIRSAVFCPVSIGDPVPTLADLGIDPRRRAQGTQATSIHPMGGVLPSPTSGPWQLVGGEETPGRWFAINTAEPPSADANSAEFTGKDAERLGRLFVEVANAGPTVMGAWLGHADDLAGPRRPLASIEEADV